MTRAEFQRWVQSVVDPKAPAWFRTDARNLASRFYDPALHDDDAKQKREFRRAVSALGDQMIDFAERLTAAPEDKPCSS